jgi:hypothetical protein
MKLYRSTGRHSTECKKGASMTDRNNRTKHHIIGNVAGHCLYRSGLVVTKVERVFNVIPEVHMKLNHACSNSKHKECIKQQLGGIHCAQDCPSVLHRYLCSGKFPAYILWCFLFSNQISNVFSNAMATSFDPLPAHYKLSHS